MAISDEEDVVSMGEVDKGFSIPTIAMITIDTTTASPNVLFQFLVVEDKLWSHLSRNEYS